MASIVFAPHRIAGEVPSGAIDGVNTTFVTASFFCDGSEAVRLNGVDQKSGPTCDYTTLESGGVGTGYDTIVFTFPLFGDDQVEIDYTAC